MLSWLLLTVVVAFFALIIALIMGTLSGSGERQSARELHPRAELMQGNRNAVATHDVDAVHLELALRGYRQDQVDDLIEALFARIDYLEQQVQGAGKTREVSAHTE
ncbi:hypothetical protein [Corynebacterium sp. sy039]|uniref:hypothetical protein n=1 Tax=Corynebacterium sp. sy039 TaxID=2599641 RepID=UPI0011B3B03E|nr:hypothetical protein [Corynebacterium sp. sy039]QDZ42332.1 hypothetical protein FQV43_03510 [Corynebacterium sp. sy039]